MSRVAVVLLTFLAIALPAPAGATSSPTGGVVRLGGVPVDLQPGTTQVVTANHTSGYRAVVAMWAWVGDRWVRRMRTADGRIGYGGLVRGAIRVQGTGTTPLGTYGLISSFGTHPRHPAWHLPYRRIRPGDFWVEDNASRYYNRYRNQRQGGFRWRLPVTGPNGSERLSDYPTQYEFSIVTSFNLDQVRHRGAGIFLHVNGDGATAGCVSAPRWFIVSLMARLRPGRLPEIAIGR